MDSSSREKCPVLQLVHEETRVQDADDSAHRESNQDRRLVCHN